MRPKSMLVVAIAALSVGAGGGYVAGAAGDPEPASAQSPSKAQPAGDSMMAGGSMAGGRDAMMTKMMDTEHTRMMRDPAMRQMHRAMLREHAKMRRDPAKRRLEDRAMRKFPEMARMMGEHMKG